MSSILDALKKLEKDDSGDVPIPSSSSRLNARKVFARPAAERSRRGILTAALSLILLIGIITIMIRWIPVVFQTDISSTAVLPHQEDRPAAVHDPIPAIRDAMPPPFPAVSIAPEPPLDTIGMGQPPRPKVEPPLELTAVFKPEIREAIPETKPPEHAEYIGPAIMDAPDKPEVPPVVAVVPVPDEEELPDEPETAKIKFREDERVAIQAIMWASDVSQRMAVINDRICKIGDIITGVTVHDIGEDYVVLDDGSNRWRQRFSVK